MVHKPFGGTVNILWHVRREALVSHIHTHFMLIHSYTHFMYIGPTPVVCNGNVCICCLTVEVACVQCCSLALLSVALASSCSWAWLCECRRSSSSFSDSNPAKALCSCTDKYAYDVHIMQPLFSLIFANLSICNFFCTHSLANYESCPPHLPSRPSGRTLPLASV